MRPSPGGAFPQLSARFALTQGALSPNSTSLEVAGGGRDRLGGVALDEALEGAVDGGQQVVLEDDARGSGVLGDLLGTRGPDDGGRDVGVLQRPRDRELGQ